MKKLLMILASSLLMATAHAQTTADISSLTTEQQAEVLKKIEAMQAPGSKNISATAREETEKWVELGGNMGKAAVGAAKELGVAANDFVATPLGKVTMAVVVYKVVGKDILGVIAGGGVLVFFLSMAVYMVRRIKYKNVVYDYKPTFFGMYNKRVVVSGTVDEDWAVGHMIAAFVCVAFALVVGLNVML